MRILRVPRYEYRGEPGFIVWSSASVDRGRLTPLCCSVAPDKGFGFFYGRISRIPEDGSMGETSAEGHATSRFQVPSLQLQEEPPSPPPSLPQGLRHGKTQRSYDVVPRLSRTIHIQGPTCSREYRFNRRYGLPVAPGKAYAGRDKAQKGAIQA